MCEEYNGWTNRETWLVGVHDFFDIEMIQEAITDMVAQPPEHTVIANNPDLGGEVKAYLLQLEDWMKEYHEEFIAEQTESLNPYICDLIADYKIDWRNIVEHYEDDIKQALKEKV